MLRVVRSRIDALLRTDGELDAFCLDEYPDIFRRFSRGMDRIEKVNMILWLAGESDVSEKLEQLEQVRSSARPNIPTRTTHPFAQRATVPSLLPQLIDETQELSLQRLREACARLDSSTSTGTAYLVSDTHLVTAATVVGQLGIGARIAAWFSGATAPALAQVCRIDPVEDWAVLQLVTPSPDRRPLPIQLSFNAASRWVAFGFTRSSGMDGQVLSGEVSGTSAVPDRPTAAPELVLEEPSADTVVALDEAGGSPVVSGGMVLGHLRAGAGQAASSTTGRRLSMCPAAAYADAAHVRGASQSLTFRTPLAEYDPLWYSARPEQERKALNKLRNPGVPLTVQAPEGYGKRWFIEHILNRLQQQDAQSSRKTHIVRFNLRKDSGGITTSLDNLLTQILQEICAVLKMDHNQDKQQDLSTWSGGAALRFRAGLEDLVFPLVPSPNRLLLLIEEGDHLHASPIETEFFALLRALAEERNPPYDRLRLCVTIAAEAGLLETTNHSWFFGLSPPIVLEGLSEKQIQAQAALYGLAADDPGLGVLYSQTLGHPFLSRLAIYEAAASEMTLAEMFALTEDQSSVFSTWLRHVHMQIENLGLMPDLCRVTNNRRHRISFESYLKLYRKGILVQGKPGEYQFRCPLFESYFSDVCHSSQMI